MMFPLASAKRNWVQPFDRFQGEPTDGKEGLRKGKDYFCQPIFLDDEV
jgi:hypothetical protein